MAKFMVPKMAEPARKRLQPIIRRAQTRAQLRQEEWMRKQVANWQTIKRTFGAFRSKAKQVVGNWVEFKAPSMVSSEKATYEVRPNGKGWEVVEAASNSVQPSEILKTFAKKQQAVNEAKRLARAQQSELKIFSRKNGVQRHLTFSV